LPHPQKPQQLSLITAGVGVEDRTKVQ
jgi:hypothetical protein